MRDKNLFQNTTGMQMQKSGHNNVDMFRVSSIKTGQANNHNYDINPGILLTNCMIYIIYSSYMEKY